MKHKFLSLLSVMVVCLSVAACGSTSSQQITEQTVQKEEMQEENAMPVGQADEAGDTIFVGQTRAASTLSPYEGSNGWSLTSHGISEGIYMQDSEGRLYSRFVKDMIQTDDYNWSVTLNDDVYFSDGSSVDAQAFCDAINGLMENNALCQVSGAGIMTATVTGELTLNIQTENITRILQSNLCEYQNVMYKDLGNGEFVYTGPYMPQSFEPGTRLDMVPNPYYPGAEERSNVSILAFGDESAMKLAFEAGEIDMAVTITANVAEMLEAEGLSTETYDAGYQYFIYNNMESQFMQEKAVRQAVNLGIDREEMITALRGGRIASGMFANYYSFAGDCATEYAPEEAERILEEAGWKLNQDGVREKNGKILELKFITYASRPDLPVLMQLAVSQLEELGIKCKAEIVDDIGAACKEGNFDLCFYAQHTAPTGDPAYFLRLAFFPTEGGNNYSRYHSEEFQKVVNQMNELPLGDERDLLAKEAQEILYEDLPVIYVLDPQWHIGVSEKMKGYRPYCGDYYVINSQLGLN